MTLPDRCKGRPGRSKAGGGVRRRSSVEVPSSSTSASFLLDALSFVFTLDFPLVFTLGWVLGLASTATAADPLPIQTTVQVFPGNWSQTYQVDLGSLPTRPRLVAEVVGYDFADPPYLSVEARNWDLAGHPGPICFAPTTSFFDDNFPGGSAVAVEVSLIGCDAQPGAFAGETVDVEIFVTNFSFNQPPGNVSITIRGETRPPTSTLIQNVDPANVPLQVVLPASKDTTVYADDPAASNGAGEFLWAGDFLSGSFPSFSRFPRRSLIAFDVNGAIPPIASVLDASLRLTTTSNNFGEPLRVRRIAPSPFGSWGEGNAVAPGDGFFGVPSPSLFAADWLYRDRPTTAWSVPGVDVLGDPLGEVAAFPGNLILSTPALADAVEDMITDGTGHAGFLLSSPNPALFPIPIQLASREHPVPEQQPALIVSYVQPAVYESGTVATNVVNYINEGQNFRWIYDLDHDNVFVTEIGGVCEVLAPTDPPRFVPYSYRYEGPPQTRIDCCTWRVDSPQTGTVGTGQALFFHNIDASDPANMPPDSDLDGIRDLCDNCPAKANGPLHGTCLIGLMGAPCRSNQECGSGGKCNLSQEDSNGDVVGNVCVVPEPGVGLALLAGSTWIAAAWRARRQAPSENDWTNRC